MRPHCAWHAWEVANAASSPDGAGGRNRSDPRRYVDWARHIDRRVDALSVLLDAGDVSSHPFVIGEIALGNLRRRDAVLTNLRLLRQTAVATHEEVLELVERHKLFGRGIGYVDTHLLAAACLTEGTLLWTFDKRLAAAAADLEIGYRPQP